VRPPLRRPLLLWLSLGLGACSSPSTSDGGVDVPRLTGRVNPISLSPSITFEGTRRFVGAIGPALGDDDLSMARPVADPATGVVIEQSACTTVRCVFVARIDDRSPNRGAAISEPSSAVPVDIRLSGTMYDYSARLNVIPTDTADGATMGASEIAAEAVYSSMSVPAGVTLRAAGLEQPVRIAVLGPVTVRGAFEFGATAMRPGPGGSAGGVPPTGDGQGPSPGIGSMVAGGGGGHGTAGASGTGMEAGAGGAASALRRLTGGSGGGAGNGGAGGHGGGALLLAGFDTMSLEGARFAFAGAPGQGAGGGGAGGMLILGGQARGAFTVDVRGGGAMMGGGAGGAGRTRFDGDATDVMVLGATPTAGPRFDLTSYQPIVREPMATIRGFAPAGMRVRVQGTRLDVMVFTATVVADASGQFSAAVRLSEGVSQIMLFDATDAASPVPSYSGTRVVVAGESGARTIAGGAIDIGYLPASDR
jgi:hypothetical protein